MSKYLDLIAFDGDDTLWHNERSYREARERFAAGGARRGHAEQQQIEDCVNRTEMANLALYGYGVSSFILSLAETAIESRPMAESPAVICAISSTLRNRC